MIICNTTGMVRVCDNEDCRLDAVDTIWTDGSDMDSAYCKAHMPRTTTIRAACSSCNHSRIDWSDLRCRKGQKQNGFGTVKPDFSCDLFDGSELAAIERKRGFVVIEPHKPYPV